MHIQILISKEINCRGNRRFGCVTKITNVTHSLRDFLPSEKKHLACLFIIMRRSMINECLVVNATRAPQLDANEDVFL